MPKLTQNQRKLLRRYLIWCYKTTKEELDRIDRYYTQLVADEFLLRELRGVKDGVNTEYLKLVDDFKNYMTTKKDNVDKKKFSDAARNKLNPQYQYLQQRFLAIEEAIVHFLGKKELTTITNLYEAEFTRRILEAREHS